MSRKIYVTILVLLIVIAGSNLALAQTPNVYNESGSNFSHLNKIKRTIDSYLNGSRGAKSYDGDYYYHVASAHFKKGEYRDAADNYSTAIRYYGNKKSKLARMHYQRGLCYYILQDYEMATRDFNVAIAYRPDITDSYYFRGKILALVYQDKYKARRDFEKVLKLSSGPTVQTAFARFFLNDSRGAMSEMRHLISKTSEFNRKAYAQVNYAMAGLQGLMGIAPGATKYLRRAFEYGYDEYDWIVNDINFGLVGNSMEFTNLLRRYNLTYQVRGTRKQYFPQTDKPAISLGDNPRNNPRNTPRPSGPQAPAVLETMNLSFSDVDGNNRIDAGERSIIRFTLENTGRAKAEDVEILVFENTRALGVDFASTQRVGDIYPNSNKEIEIPITGQMDIESGQADFTIEIRERNGFDAGNLYITIPTASYQPPKLEVVDHHFASELGGKMRLGVPITLKMAVQNTGSGEAQDVSVKFNLPENVFSAGDDVFNIGNLRPGESQVIDYEFFTNRRFAGSEVPIYMEITDQNNLVREKTSVSVRINETLEINDRVIINAKPTEEYEIKDIQLLSDVDRDLPRTRNRNSDAIAVVIGNRDYLNPDVPSVDFALQDAASMKKYLIESFGFDENNILFLPNATQADFNGIFGTKEDHKARLFNLVKPDQSDVFVFYSGHGAPDLETKEAYFVPVDCDPSLVKFNGYAINTFYDNLAKIPFRSLTVVLDACFSGTSDRGTLIPQSSLVRVKSSGSVLKDPRAMIFTSASGTEIASWYPEQSHSLFTYYFLKGLQGAANTNRDGSVTLGEMSDYLINNVPYEARRMKNRVQTPQIYGRNDKALLRY